MIASLSSLFASLGDIEPASLKLPREWDIYSFGGTRERTHLGAYGRWDSPIRPEAKPDRRPPKNTIWGFTGLPPGRIAVAAKFQRLRWTTSICGLEDVGKRVRTPDDLSVEGEDRDLLNAFQDPPNHGRNDASL